MERQDCARSTRSVVNAGGRYPKLMEILYLLIPLSLALLFLMDAVFWHALISGQFKDLEGPAHRILMGDEGPAASEPEERPASSRDGERPS